jgi:hypothetical protein
MSELNLLTKSLYMKKILFLTGMAILLSTSGCIVAGGDGRDHHARYEHHDDGPAAVVVVARPVVVIH